MIIHNSWIQITHLSQTRVYLMENNQDQLKNCSVKIIKIIIMIRLISLTFVSHFLRKNKQNKFQSNTRAKNNFNMMKNNNGMKKQKKRNNQ